MSSNHAKNRDKKIALRQRELFEHIRKSFEQGAKTPLNIVVCGPGAPSDENPEHFFHFREAVKKELNRNGDNAFYIEDLLNSKEGKILLKEIAEKLGFEPDLKHVELFILKYGKTEKDIHIAEGPGSLLELRDFEDYPSICQKLKVFVHKKHVMGTSYASGLIVRLGAKGAKIFSFSSQQDLLSKVEKALKPNRINKYVNQEIAD